MRKLITQLGYVGFEVADLSRWQRFATKALGLEVAPAALGGSLRLRLDDHRQRILLREGPADDLVFTGWQAPHAAAVEAFGRHLESLGIASSCGHDDDVAWRAVQRMLHFVDPQGQRHEVDCGPQLANNVFASPKVASGFVTGNEGRGHLVCATPQPAQMVRFAQQVLGLSLSDEIHMPVGPGLSFDVTFLHVNARHHSFAVAPQPPTPGPHKRLHHLMLEVRGIEDVGFARDRFLDMGQAVHMDIGQHTNDKMISFYGQTPSGFLLEVGWGGRQGERSDVGARHLQPCQPVGPPARWRGRVAAALSA